MTENVLGFGDGDCDSPGPDHPICRESNETKQSNKIVSQPGNALELLDGSTLSKNTRSLDNADGTQMFQEDAVSQSCASFRHGGPSQRRDLEHGGQHELEDDFRNAKPAVR